MEIENRRFARNLFPESPSSSNESLSSENTIGPISPLLDPEKPYWSIQTSLKKSAAMLRRSPRNIHKDKRLDSSISMLDTILVGQTPEKNEPNSQNCLVTPHTGPTINSKQVLNTPIKPGRVFIEESPDLSIGSPTMSSKVSVAPEIESKGAYSPRTGLPCSVFYAKPKAKLSLFADFILKRPVVVTVKQKRGQDTHQGFAAKRKSVKRSKRDMYGKVNKNVWHGIKKPKLKKVQMANKLIPIPKEVPTTLESQPQTPVKVLKPRVSLVKLPSPKPDPNKKFFKTNRTLEINRMAIVTVDKNIRLEVSNGKMSLQRNDTHLVKKTMSPKKLPAEMEPAFEPMSELDDPVKNDLQQKVSNILDHLADDIDLDGKENNSTIFNGTLVENVVQSFTPAIGTASSPFETKQHPICLAETILRDVAALDIVSPKSASKLFPIFNKEYAHQQQLQSPTQRKSPRAHKRQWHEIGVDQYQIDAGQRKFGATQCSECGVVYQFGDPDDERAHQKHHNGLGHLKFPGWKNERVVNEFENGRVLGIYPGDPKVWRNKVVQVLQVVDRELGSSQLEEVDLISKKVFLYISERQVVGCLVAETISEGYRMLSDLAEVDCCSTEGSPVFCGVLRVWTATNWRRKKIATRLIDSMRANFLFGCILGKNDIAFSVPTVNGKDFAKSYTSTWEYLVYA